MRRRNTNAQMVITIKSICLSLMYQAVWVLAMLQFSDNMLLIGVGLCVMGLGCIVLFLVAEQERF